MMTLYRRTVPMFILIACLLAGSLASLPGACSLCEQAAERNGLGHPGGALLDSADIEEDDVLGSKDVFSPGLIAMAESAALSPGFFALRVSPQLPPPRQK